MLEPVGMNDRDEVDPWALARRWRLVPAPIRPESGQFPRTGAVWYDHGATADEQAEQVARGIACRALLAIDAPLTVDAVATVAGYLRRPTRDGRAWSFADVLEELGELPRGRDDQTGVVRCGVCAERERAGGVRRCGPPDGPQRRPERA